MLTAVLTVPRLTATGGTITSSTCTLSSTVETVPRVIDIPSTSTSGFSISTESSTAETVPRSTLSAGTTVAS